MGNHQQVSKPALLSCLAISKVETNMSLLRLNTSVGGLHRVNTQTGQPSAFLPVPREQGGFLNSL